MKKRACVSAILARLAFIMSCARFESMIPTRGSRRMPVQISVTGVDISMSDWVWAANIALTISL
jgi:hypothetical protein